MGNCHSVTQIKPTVHKNGAVIKVKTGQEESFRKVYESLKDKDNTSLSIPKGEITCPNINESANQYQIPSNDLYMVLASGSKYGYSDELRMVYKKTAPYLEDALFFITDEYSEYIEQFEIKNGKFINAMVVPENGDLVEYYEKSHPQDKEAIFELLRAEALDLAKYINDGWPETIEEAIKLVNKALKMKPDDIELLTLTGRLFTYTKKYKQAIKTFEKIVIMFKKQYSNVIKKAGIGLIWLEKEQSEKFRQLYISFAYVYNRDKQFNKAIEICEEGKRIAPTLGSFALDEYKTYALLNLMRYEEALSTCDQIIRSCDKRNFIAFAFYNKACALTGLGRLDEASAFMAAAFSLDPHKFPPAFKSDKDIEALLNYKNLKKIMGPLHDLIPQ